MASASDRAKRWPTWLRAIVNRGEVPVRCQFCAPLGAGQDRDHGEESFAMIDAPFKLRRRGHHRLLFHVVIGGNDGRFDVAKHHVDTLERRTL